MFRIIAIMFAGVAIGLLLRRSPLAGWISRSMMVTIVVLLFLMGVEIGGNEHIIENLPSLGWEALLIAVAATMGSVVAARIVYKVLHKPNAKADEE